MEDIHTFCMTCTRHTFYCRLLLLFVCFLSVKTLLVTPPLSLHHNRILIRYERTIVQATAALNKHGNNTDILVTTLEQIQQDAYGCATSTLSTVRRCARCITHPGVWRTDCLCPSTPRLSVLYSRAVFGQIHS